MMYLNPENAFIFRITHVDNVAWILEQGGLHCQNAPTADPNFVNIGNTELIGKRANRDVPVAPGGTLSDYVPFYFTPHSIMMYNIVTGYAGITERPRRDLVLFVTSLHKLYKQDITYAFTNKHAYSVDTSFFTDLVHLSEIDWALLQRQDFKRDSENDPGKQLRYNAEALVHQHVPLDAIRSIVCYNETVGETLREQAAVAGAEITVKVAPSLYFTP